MLFRNHYPLKIYLLYKPTFVLFGLSLLMQLVMWIWLLRTIGIHSNTVFLHYTILYGVDLTGPAYRVYALPLVGLGILLVNVIVGWMYFRKDKFISIVLNSVAVICQAFLFIGAALLAFLNT